MTNQLTKPAINFILSAFLLLDPHSNGLTKNDLDHYFLNKILFSNMKTSESNMMTIMHSGIDELEEFSSCLNLLIKKVYIHFDNKYYLINYHHHECIEYVKMYKNILKIFDIKLDENYIESEEEDIKSNEDDIMSNEYDDIQSEESITQESKDLQEFKYLVKSSTDKKTFYKINEALTECTCKAFEFSKEDPSTCKHLEYCKKVDKSKLVFMNDSSV